MRGGRGAAGGAERARCPCLPAGWHDQVSSSEMTDRMVSTYPGIASATTALLRPRTLGAC